MSEEYGANFITVTDEDGNEFELEHLDTLELNGQTYLAFFPAVQEGEEEKEEEMGLVILKAIQENGEEILSTLDSDEEIDAVYQEFMKELFSDEEEEDWEDDDDCDDGGCDLVTYVEILNRIEVPDDTEEVELRGHKYKVADLWEIDEEIEDDDWH